MKKILFAAVTATLGLASAAQASGCGSPYCQGSGFFGGRGHGHGLPAFQAAPWYLYWPYNQHFMTPAPMQGAYSAPPGSGYGGGMVNPYFPGGGMPGGGSSYPQQMPGGYSPPAPGGYIPPPSSGGNPTFTPPAPAPMPQPNGVPPVGATPPVTSPPAGAVPPVIQPPAGTPGASVPVIPAVPGLIRTAGRR